MPFCHSKAHQPNAFCKNPRSSGCKNGLHFYICVWRCQRNLFFHHGWRWIKLNLLCMGGTCTSVVIADFISIVGPNVPEVDNFGRLLSRVIHNFEHWLFEYYLETWKHLLKCNHCNLGLKKVSSIQTVQAVGPKNSPLPHDHFVFFGVVYIEF